MPDDKLPPIRRMPPSPGGQLRPEDVVGRDREIRRAWELLDRASVRLNEPRRIGKTSVLFKMEAAAPPGWVCVRQSFQGVRTVDELAARALGAISGHQRLPKRARDKARQFLASAKVSAKIDQVTFELNPAFRTEPIASLEAALDDVNRALGETRLLLAWDEIPDAILAVTEEEGIATAANLLEVLRRFREGAGSSIRWLLTGSVGFHHVLGRMERGDSFVNDLDNLPLGPLSAPWAVWLSASLLAGADVSADQAAAEELASVSGGIPYLAHLVAKQARDRRLTHLAARDVEPLFDEAANDLDQSQQATHFLSRIGPYYGEQALAAEWILDRTSERGLTRQQLLEAAANVQADLPPVEELRDLLNRLCLDHYLTKTPATEAVYEWRYPPLARVWRIRRA